MSTAITMPQAIDGLKRFNAELLELEAHLFDMLLALQLKLKRRRPPRPRHAPARRTPQRHPSGGLPGYLFSGKNTGGTG